METMSDQEEGRKWAVCLFCHKEGDIDDMVYHDGKRHSGYAHEDCLEAVDEMCVRCATATSGNGVDCDQCEVDCFQSAVKKGEINLSGLNAAEEIKKHCWAIQDMLLEKNRKYGNSALDPVRVFSKANKAEQIRVRIDDKLSRMKNLQDDDNEDVINDLIGYLILLKIAIEQGQE